MRYLILARDPASDVLWSIVLQTEEIDVALDFWHDLPNDPSDRIMLDTENFITFADQGVPNV